MAEWFVRPKEAGRRAQEIWRPLVGIIEDRWKERFSSQQVEPLISSLTALGHQLDLDLPPPEEF
jgi:hypothetical protein